MSDSSEDENSQFLKEALDTELINNEMYNGNKQTSEEIITKAVSLRPHTNSDDQFNMLDVTPQFQEYVAKQLSSILEKKLTKRLVNRIDNSVPHKRFKGGIKLFSDSAKFLKLKTRSNFNKKPTINTNACTESVNEEKCNEVAVSPEDILSKKEVASWATRKNPKIFEYCKDKNGALNLIN